MVCIEAQVVAGGVPKGPVLSWGTVLSQLPRQAQLFLRGFYDSFGG